MTNLWAAGDQHVYTKLNQMCIGTIKYNVRKNGTYYEAIDDATKVLTFGGSSNAGSIVGTDAAAVLQAAMDNLTAGRTSMETIVTQGTLTFNDYLSIPSYTEIINRGKWLVGSPTDAANNYLIENSDQTSGNIDIRITGGVIDNNDVCGGIANFEKVTNLTIDHIKFTQPTTTTKGTIDLASTNVVFAFNTLERIHILNAIDPAKHVKIVNNYMLDLYDSGVSVGSATATQVEDVLIAGNSMDLDEQAVGFGVDVFGNIKDVVVRDNHINGTYFDGIFIQADGAETYSPENVRVHDNFVYSPRNNRSNIKVNTAASGVVIDNNYCYAPLASYFGIQVYKGSNIKISKNTIDGNDLGNGGISVFADAVTVDSVNILDNTILNCTTGIHLVEANCGTISHVNAFFNDVQDTTTKFTIAGCSPRLFANHGYVTENSGSGTYSDGDNIPINLSIAPTSLALVCANRIVNMGYTSADASNINGVRLQDTTTGNPFVGTATVVWMAEYRP